jgi:hypothetical protein
LFPVFDKLTEGNSNTREENIPVFFLSGILISLEQPINTTNNASFFVHTCCGTREAVPFSGKDNNAQGRLGTFGQVCHPELWCACLLVLHEALGRPAAPPWSKRLRNLIADALINLETQWTMAKCVSQYDSRAELALSMSPPGPCGLSRLSYLSSLLLRKSLLWHVSFCRQVTGGGTCWQVQTQVHTPPSNRLHEMAT